MQKRTYLTITPESKPDALRAAGRLPDGSYPLVYDASQKLWYAVAEADLEKVKAWLPENTVSGQSMTVADNLSPAEEFANVLEKAGFILPDDSPPIMDGRRHRVATKGDTGGKKSGIYQGYMDGRPAGWYQNHRASEGKVNWKSTGTFQYDPVEAIRQKALAAQKRWDREIQSREDYARIAKTLAQQWSKMPAAPDTHPYLSRKGVPATDGVRQDKYGNLVIPLHNIDGELRTLQYIKPDGTKNMKKDAEKSGNFFVVGGELVAQRPVLYAEGYATAASIHLATGMPVVMTVDAGNTVTVSHKLKERFPDSPHIILGDDDFTKRNVKGELENKGLIKATEAAEAIGGIYVLPQFTDSERAQAFAKTASFSDFNDIHMSRGLDAVRDQLAPVLDPLTPDWRQPFTEEHTMRDTDVREDLPPEQPSADFAEYAAYMQEEPSFPTGEDPVPQETIDAEPVTAAQEPPETTSAPPEAEMPPVTGETEPEIAESVPPEPGFPPADTTLQTDEPTPVPPDSTTQPETSDNTVAAVIPEAEQTGGLPDASALRDEVEPAPIQPRITGAEANTAPQVSEAAPHSDEQQAKPAEDENGFSFTFGRLPGDISPQDTVAPINLDELLQGLTSRQDGKTWVYALDGEDAFRDYGDRIVMATPQASENDRMILAALLSAKANQRGAVEITGSEDFIQRTMTLIADHNIEVHLKNPLQRAQFEALMKTRAESTTPQDGLTMGTADEKAEPAATGPVPETPAPNHSPSAAPSPSGAGTAAPELSVVEKETLRTGLTGKLLDAGKAPYKFDQNNADSFYVQLRTKAGNKEFWGVELESALNDSGKKPGDMVKLQFLGKQPVTINVPIKNDEGKVTGFERRDTHRNQWSITPAADNRLLVADRKTVEPAALSAYDGNAFWKLQQQLIQAAGLSLSTPAPDGHGLLYTGPDGQGQPGPVTPPINAPVPQHSKAAGSVVMQAFTADGELLAHLVKGHGDYLQGVIRHEGQLQNVLARICTGSNGNTWLALNAVQNNGTLSLIGHGSAVNNIRNGTANYDTFAFQMKGPDAPKFAVPLVSPEKIPPALHSKLGFTHAWAPPKAEEPVLAPRAQVKPAQPQPM